MPVSIGVSLEEDSTGCMFGHIGGYGEGGRQIGEVENGLQEEEAFKEVEGGLARGRPVPRKAFLGKINEGMGNVGVVRNKVLIEIGEDKEGANVLYLGWSRPACNSVELNRVHSQLAGFYYHSEVFNLVRGKLAFFEL